MNMQPESVDAILHSLQERAKELKCLYEVDELLAPKDEPQEVTLRKLAAAIPPGWQFPAICHAVITIDGHAYGVGQHPESPWVLRAEVAVDSVVRGEVAVFYHEDRPPASEGPFLLEERRLINAIADRVGHYLQRKLIRSAHDSFALAIQAAGRKGATEWRIILDLLRRADHALFSTITRKMINYLCWSGVDEAIMLLREYLSKDLTEAYGEAELNRPVAKGEREHIALLSDRVFAIAEQHCSEEEIVLHIRTWVEEDRAAALVEALENAQHGYAEVAAALDRYVASEGEDRHAQGPLRRSVGAALLRRFFSLDLEFLGVLKDRVRVSDFHRLIHRVIHTPGSQGRLGGKSTGLFVAETLIRDGLDKYPAMQGIRVPRTWYIASDGALAFVRHNNLDDVHAQKYQPIERVRRDYPHLVSVFKNSAFPTELVNGIAAALDDLGEVPLIVRSSSLLEDQNGAAFSGKYKSLFLANQGTKSERLEALLDAVAEVYSSLFSPDPIEYRAQRGLLDVHEEMAVMIQEVVGFRAGRFFLPAFSGVAFSRNEFRWSPRIRREDGLIRLVPGLGTRAVDRIGDDYPVLMAPGQPGLRVNVSPREIERYSPRKADVIDLERNVFETVDIVDLMREVGDRYPGVRKLISVVSEGRVRPPVGLEPDWQKDRLAVTFEGLLEDGSFVKGIGDLLEHLERELGYPVDLEFACDGTAIYLLQCRVQSAAVEFGPVEIPQHLPPEDVLFTAHRYVSNGRVPDLTHIVYVDAQGYANLRELSELKEVARAVGRLNSVLPHRQFALIGPGRWGSRGDIRLGVGVTYADINNTAALLEVAWKRGNYAPELSFGTHFFQDLVEADIRYLPLYPDDAGVVFNQEFLLGAPNMLAHLVPDFKHLGDVIRVVDVPGSTGGRVLRMLLNADSEEAVGCFVDPGTTQPKAAVDDQAADTTLHDHWRWRLQMAERLAAQTDPESMGVRAMYVIGSAKNATAGPASDLDILVHFEGSPLQRDRLTLWLDAWSAALGEVNYQRTGQQTEPFLDVHIVTDEDIRAKTSYAVKIGAVTDPARPLAVGRTES